MKHLLDLFSMPDRFDPALEREFRSVYQGPRFRYMQASFALATLGFGIFLLMDFLNGTESPLPGVSAVRALIVAAFATGLAATYLNRQLVVRHYTIIVNFYSALGMLGAALLPMAVHGDQSSADVYWSLTSSLTTAVIVIYGFNRLSARNTAWIVTSGCLLGVSTVFLRPSFDWYSFARLSLHLVVVNLVAASLRGVIERRERELFLLARENLSKNVYAKELEAARALAEEGNEIKLRFLANMSHEFRTPMNGVLQTLDLVSRTASRDVLHLLDKARASGHALLRTLNSILEYTAWTQKALTPNVAVVSLSATVQEIVERHRQPASERGLEIALRLDLARSEDRIVTDRRLLEEIFSQLLGNAVRFTRAGSVRVNVELKKQAAAPYPAADVELTISDTGIGIPQQLQELVFTAFYQVDSASNREVGGTGLGLAIARRLSDVMRGAITLESTVGVGTTVRFRFPTEIRKPEARRSRALQRVPPKPIGAPERLEGMVLLAEDNELNAALVTELLTLLGLSVTHAGDGEQAHRCTLERRFDVILMDCQMPRVDGYEATRRIRASEQSGGALRTPIVAVTANALSGDRERCLDAGMDDYLPKPYTVQQLHAKLVTWLPGTSTLCAGAESEREPVESSPARDAAGR